MFIQKTDKNKYQYVKSDPNINTDELAVGATLTKFIAMVEGVCDTITQVESNKRKKHIQDQFSTVDDTDVSIIMDINYGQAMMKYDFAHFVKEKSSCPWEYESQEVQRHCAPFLKKDAQW